MNRLDRATLLYLDSPAMAMEWPEALIRKLDRALRRKPGHPIKLTQDEHDTIIRHTGVNPDPAYRTEWFNHRGKQVVVSCVEPKIWRL